MADQAAPALTQAYLAQAAAAARAGAYAEAEFILGLAPSPARSALELDLLARIRAQQGRLAEAERLWRDALAMDPDSLTFAAGLAKAMELQRRRPWLTALGRIAPLTLVLLALWAAWRIGGEGVGAGGAATGPATTENAPGTTTPGDRPAPDSDLLAALEKRLTMDRVAVIRSEGILNVVPHGPLFTEGTALSADGGAILTTVGHRLEPFVGRVTIELIGHTDGLPLREGAPWPDNLALGAARAVTALEHLRATTELPARGIRLGTEGEHPPPRQGDDDEPGPRRTVIVRVRPIGHGRL